ncbi:MAG: helix-turn-helix transcriptional regulator [Chloroflexota bacterium]|nr:helix-turn-helix transcriptional regulator [Chloroflexota bacterium]
MNEPCYVISIAARMIGVHAQTLRYYERAGIIEPSRSQGNQRLYSEEDIAKLRQIKTLVDDLGINLAGVEIILRLTRKINVMENQIQQLESEISQLKAKGKMP